MFQHSLFGWFRTGYLIFLPCRSYSIFRSGERIFRSGECTFRSAEYTFPTAEYKTIACFRTIGTDMKISSSTCGYILMMGGKMQKIGGQGEAPEQFGDALIVAAEQAQPEQEVERTEMEHGKCEKREAQMT